MSLPDPAVVAKHRVEEEKTFAAIASMYGVSRQAVHKSFKRWATKHGVDWKSRTQSPA